MSGVVRIAELGRNAMLDALRALMHGGTLDLYTGPQPAAPETPTDEEVLLGTLQLADPVCPAASGGVLTFSAITGENAALASGVIAWARLRDADGVAVLDLPAGVTGSGSALELDTTTVAEGQPINCGSATLTLPAGG